MDAACAIFTARGDLKEMKKARHAFFYHTGDEKQVVGVVEVIRESYHDPSDEKGVFLAVDVKAVKPFPKPVHAGGDQGRAAAQGDGAGQVSAPVGAAGDRAGMEDRLHHGRAEGVVRRRTTQAVIPGRPTPGLPEIEQSTPKSGEPDLGA